MNSHGGNELYIFLSYSNKDSEKVIPILENLQHEGIKFCPHNETEKYDDDSESISWSILNCMGVLAFHSGNSKNSLRCRNEISFACANKKIVSVYLEDVELSLGVQMAIHQFPQINFYQYSKRDYDKFFSELLNAVKSFPLSSQNLSVAKGVPGIAGAIVSGAAVVGSRVGVSTAVGTLTYGGKTSFPSIRNLFGIAKDFIMSIGAKEPSNLNEDMSPKFSQANLKISVKPYEGNRAYAFISYSHKDSAKVLEILHNFQLAGLRFWYDAGIGYGSEWDECIAEHICSCECMIAFHSKNSDRSPHCKNEISFLNFNGTDKKILSIYLENVNLSMGTQMKINRFQAINFYDYRHKKIFYSEMIKSPIICSCLS